MRIVYVEDNIANVHLVKRVARMGKHEVISYIDGMDAFNNFDTDNPDLVLMDIQLAGELTGIEVVKKLRDKGFKAPIYAVTAYAMVGDRERCMEAGCTGYISKPIPIPDLVKLFTQYDQPKPSVVNVSQDKLADDLNETKTLLSAEHFIKDNAKEEATESQKSAPLASADDLIETKTLVSAKNIKKEESDDEDTVLNKSDSVEKTKPDNSANTAVEAQSTKPTSDLQNNQETTVKPKASNTKDDNVADIDNDDTITMNKDEPAQMI